MKEMFFGIAVGMITGAVIAATNPKAADMVNQAKSKIASCGKSQQQQSNPPQQQQQGDDMQQDPMF